jgi:hypothetical protein
MCNGLEFSISSVLLVLFLWRCISRGCSFEYVLILLSSVRQTL